MADVHCVIGLWGFSSDTWAIAGNVCKMQALHVQYMTGVY